MKKFDLKKLIILLLALTLVFSLFACGKDEPDPVEPTTPVTPTEPVDETEPVLERVDELIKAIGPTIDAVAAAPKDGLMGAEAAINLYFSLGDKIDIDYTLAIDANVDLLGTNEAVDNVGVISVLDGDEVIASFYLLGEELFITIPAAEVKAAVQIGDLVGALENADFEGYDFETAGLDLDSMVGGVLPLISAFLKLDETTGVLSIDDSVLSAILPLLPGLLGDSIDLDGIIQGIEGMEDYTFEDAAKFLKIGIAIDFDVNDAGLLENLSLDISIRAKTDAEVTADTYDAITGRSEFTEVPDVIQDNLPAINLGLVIDLKVFDYSDTTTTLGNTVAAPTGFVATEYTKTSVLNLMLSGEMAVEGTEDVYTIDLLADLDPMALLSTEEIGIFEENLEDKLGKLTLVVKKNDTIIAEGFYDSAVDPGVAYCYVNVSSADGEDTFKKIMSVNFSDAALTHGSDKSAYGYDEKSTESSGSDLDILGMIMGMDFGGIIAKFKTLGTSITTAEDGDVTVSAALLATLGEIVDLAGFDKMIEDAITEAEATWLAAEVADVPFTVNLLNGVFDYAFGTSATGLTFSDFSFQYGEWSIVAVGEGEAAVPAYDGFVANQAEQDYITSIELVDSDIDLTVGNNLPATMAFNVLKYGETEAVELDIPIKAVTTYDNLLVETQYIVINPEINLVEGYGDYLTLFYNKLTVNFKAAESGASITTKAVANSGTKYAIAGENVDDYFGFKYVCGDISVDLSKSYISTFSRTGTGENAVDTPVSIIDNYGDFSKVAGEYVIKVNAGNVSAEYIVVLSYFDIVGASFSTGTSATPAKFYITYTYIDAEGVQATEYLTPAGVTYSKLSVDPNEYNGTYTLPTGLVVEYNTGATSSRSAFWRASNTSTAGTYTVTATIVKGSITYTQDFTVEAKAK